MCSAVKEWQREQWAGAGCTGAEWREGIPAGSAIQNSTHVNLAFLSKDKCLCEELLLNEFVTS